MVHVDLATKKIIRTYCYADAIPVIWNEAKQTERKARTSKTLNSLFVNLHLGDFKVYSTQVELVTCLSEPDEEDYNEELNDIITDAFGLHLSDIEVL